MDAALTILDRTKNFLAQCRADAQKLLNDQRARQWETISFESCLTTLEDFDLPLEELKTAKNNFRKTAELCIGEITKLENEIGALATEIRYKSIQPQQAEKSADVLEKRSLATMEKLTAKLTLFSNIFAEADKTIRENISFYSMIERAKRLKGAKPLAIDEGYTFYKMIKDSSDEGGEGATFFNFHSDATKLGKAIKDIDLSELPGLVATIVDHQIQTALKLADQIKNYVEYLEQRVQAEISAIDKYQDGLQPFSERDLKYIFDNIDTMAESAGKEMINLSRKAQTLSQYQLIPPLLKDLRNFYHIVKKVLLVDLKGQIQVVGSPINPINLAAEKTAQFFYDGFTGLVRTVKLFFSSMAGKQLIGKDDLQLLLVDAMSNCVIFYSNKPTDLEKLKKYINTYLEPFSKPFPYEELFRLMKDSLNNYGTELEQYVSRFEVTVPSAQSDNGQAGQQESGSSKIAFGRLVRKFELATEKLRTT